ncbi:MAG: fructosamine kinase family protein [Acidimicrobiales bacterium]
MDALEEVVGTSLGSAVRTATVVRGGDVAQAFRFELADGRRVFAKTHPSPPPGFFTTEATGLGWLREPGVVAVPEVLAVSDGDNGTPPHLVLEWIDVGPAGADTESALGSALAALHRAHPGCFGRDDRRTTGSRGLPNEPCSTWAEFYATQRLSPLARLAAESAALPARSIAQLERLDPTRLAEVGGPSEPPARLHGDLWAGNRLVDDGGRSWLIDPAAHGGHREFDLAMMRLFGGFGTECYSAYQQTHPLADGWQDRVALHQIAPLVVHAIKFGGGYVSSAADAIARCA